jgi:putative molybdopterin biosynthesis protein
MSTDNESAAGAGPSAGNLTGAGGEPNGIRLRLARLGRGFSQQQLATMAGVSRQAVSAVESGLSDPSLRVALALSRALGVTVEEMFGPVTPEPRVQARLLAPLEQGTTRVSLAQVGGSYVAAPLAGAAATRSGFVPASGLADGLGSETSLSTPPIWPLGPPRPTLIVAGCDPALPLLEVPLGLLEPAVPLLWWQCASQEALDLAANGLVHAAGSHLRDQSGDYNIGPARTQFRQGAEVIGFCAWREGIVLRPEVAGAISGLADVASAGLRMVNRQPGSEARLLLDRELTRIGLVPTQVNGYGTQATGHLQVASAIAAGLADAGIASEPAAVAYGLAFIPLATERSDIVIPSPHIAMREVQGLLRVLNSRWLRDQLASLPGYDPTRCGEVIASLPPFHGRPAARPASERRRSGSGRR